MIALDFFLYDNRTWSPRWGRDWGLKAATGVLAGRADLKAAFDRYCGAMPGGQGQLQGFGEAIGGLRAPTGDGYLLCVMLESADSFGRPSWAVFGLWCRDRATLEQVLAGGDPIGSARALLGGETPPNAIEILPAKTAVRPRRRRSASAAPAFHRFDSKSTVREVIALLLGAVQSTSPLPNVLGITATSRLAALARAGFDVAYCHPMDDRTERALARALSPPEPEVEEPWLPPVEPTTPPVVRQARPQEPWPATQPTRPGPRSSSVSSWLFWLSIAIVGAVVSFVVVDDLRRGSLEDSRESSPSGEGEEPAAAEPPVLEAPGREERSAESVLGEVRERLEECKALVPEALKESEGFVVAETLEVVPEYQERRIRVRRAYEALLEIRGRVVKRYQGNYVAYYFDESGKAAPTATRLQKIAGILREAPLGGEDCKVLRDAFGFELENRDSVLSRWCESLGRLETTVNSVVRSADLPALPRRVRPGRSALHQHGAVDGVSVLGEGGERNSESSAR